MKQLTKKEIKKFMKKTPKSEKEIVIILENIQYARNVAGVFRTADATGVRKTHLTGISHTPPFGKDLQKASRRKERSVQWEFHKKSTGVINELKGNGFVIIAVELTDESFPLSELREKTFKEDKICFVFGSEVYGIVKETLAECDEAVYIPMYGKGASLNVGVSVGVVLYHSSL